MLVLSRPGPDRLATYRRPLFEMLDSPLPSAHSLVDGLSKKSKRDKGD